MIPVAVFLTIAALGGTAIWFFWSLLCYCANMDRARRDRARRVRMSHQTENEGVDCLHCRSVICERHGCMIEEL